MKWDFSIPSFVYTALWSLLLVFVWNALFYHVGGQRFWISSLEDTRCSPIFDPNLLDASEILLRHKRKTILEPVQFIGWLAFILLPAYSGSAKRRRIVLFMCFHWFSFFRIPIPDMIALTIWLGLSCHLSSLFVVLACRHNSFRPLLTFALVLSTLFCLSLWIIGVMAAEKCTKFASVPLCLLHSFSFIIPRKLAINNT